jgi:type IV pilus biogenesis protein CpaD/CtpE
MIRNGTLTGATWGSTLAGGQVDVDTGATAISFAESDIISLTYANASNQSTASIAAAEVYNWALQIGVDLAGTSDIYTLAAAIDGGTGDVLGNISFWNLTA